MPKPGAAAPAFTLPCQDGSPVSLASLAGSWVVLYFYPKDDTPGCTTEACEFTASMRAFAALGAKVLGVSPDSPASHARFMAKHRLAVTLLSDTDKTMMKAYGAWGQKLMYGKPVTGVIRSTVLIDPKGRIAQHWPKVKAAGHAAAVHEVLVALAGGGTQPAAKGKPVAARAARKPARARQPARKRSG